MTIEIRIIATFLAAFFVTMFVLPNLSHFAERIGLVDMPDERKVHKVPLPLVGGIGIVIAVTFSFLTFVPFSGMAGYCSGMILLLVVGLMDDLQELGHRKKFMAQIVATALLIYMSKTHLSDFGNLFGWGEIIVPDIGWLIWGVTVFCVVGVTNAVNMIDGLDGLAGSISFISFLTFSVLSSLAGNTTLMLLNLALAGALLGFLRYNWTPAVLFMGDAGSLCLGFSLAFMALALTQVESSLVQPVIVLLVLAVPISDTLTVMIRRICNGKSPFKPDNTHLHHILLRHGFDGKKPIKIMLFLSVILCGISIFGVILHVPESLLFSIFVVYFALNWFADHFAETLAQGMNRFQRKGELPDSPATIQSLFHREKRYNVEIQIRYNNYLSRHSLPGKIITISKAGFWARIDKLGVVCRDCIVTITFPGVRELQSVEMPVEHIWMSSQHNDQCHGFKFLDLEIEQQSILTKLIDSLEKRGGTLSSHDNRDSVQYPLGV